MKLKIFFSLLLLSSCAFKEPQASKASQNTLSSPSSEVRTLLSPPTYPIITSLEFKGSILLKGSFKTNLLNLSSQDNSLKGNPLRSILISKALTSGDFSYDERMDFFIKLPSFNYDELTLARSLIESTDTDDLFLDNSLLEVRLSRESIEHTPLNLSLYTLENGNLYPFSKESSLNSLGELNFTLTNLNSFLSVIKNETPLYLSLASPLKENLDFFKTHTRIILSFPHETKILYPEANMTLSTILKNENIDFSFQGKGITQIEDNKSEITFSDLTNPTTENLNLGKWVNLSSLKSFDETLNPSQTYAFVFVTPKDYLDTLSKREEILNTTLTGEDSKSASVALSNLRNEDILEISYTPEIAFQKLVTINSNPSYKISKCTYGKLLTHTCYNPSGGWERDLRCDDRIEECFNYSTCESFMESSKNYNGDRFDFQDFTCLKNEPVSFSCKLSRLALEVSPFQKVPSDFDLSEIRATLVVGPRRIPLTDAFEISSLKDDSKKLSKVSLKIKVEGLPKEAPYKAYIELSPEDRNPEEYDILSTDCSNEVLKNKNFKGTLQSETLQKLNLKVTRLKRDDSF